MVRGAKMRQERYETLDVAIVHQDEYRKAKMDVKFGRLITSLGGFIGFWKD